MENKQKFNKEMLFNYTPSVDVLAEGMKITTKLGKLNVRLSGTFHDYKIPSRLFAFIESKYSSKIEGIYTTLFDVVNTGHQTKQQHLIEPIVNELFKGKEVLTIEKLLEIEDKMNFGVDKTKRFDEAFGIYKTTNDKKERIYQPPMNIEEIAGLLAEVISKAEKDENIVEMFHTHILFEKVHPFVDANGRIGRLILQRSMARLVNFSNVLPMSNLLFKYVGEYYQALDISNNDDINKGVLAFLKIIDKMYIKVKALTKDLNIFVDKYIQLVMSSSNKVTDHMARRILLTLQTKSIYLQHHYKLNPRTIDSIFSKINIELPFNRKTANRNILYWNIELEEIINKHFGE